MPSFKFDVTDEAVAYTQEAMSGLATNNGQESLLEQLIIDAYCIVTVYIAGDNVDVKSDYDISFFSDHPNAIEDILNEGEQSFQEFSERAGDIMGLIDLAWSELG
jgi:hypothetical protein